MITDIRLQNFRSYRDESFEVSPAVNIVVGPNASGKTNLLEALLVIARGGSYRARDQELIQFTKPWARLEAHTTHNDTRRVTITLEDGKAEKQFTINDHQYKRLVLHKSLPIVLFEPNHLQLLGGSPELRRQFLDDLLEQTEIGYASLRRDYKRALAQRNRLLKLPHNTSDQLFVWNIRLGELGERVAKARAQLVVKLNEQAAEHYQNLSRSKANVTLDYQSVVPIDNYGTDLVHKLEAHTAIDKERGFTTHGPHREDFSVYFDGHPAQESASRGEIRTLLLVLKITEAVLLEEVRELRPVLLLDDVFSELDGARRQALTDFLQPYQSFITTTDADVVIHHFTESANIIPTSQ